MRTDGGDILYDIIMGNKRPAQDPSDRERLKGHGGSLVADDQQGADRGSEALDVGLELSNYLRLHVSVRKKIWHISDRPRICVLAGPEDQEGTTETEHTTHGSFYRTISFTPCSLL
jgi:hypothetical protein